jgi:hypothetical protein
MNAWRDELPSSAVWRIAKNEGMTLTHYVECEFDLNWSQCRSDLDHILPHISSRSGAWLKSPQDDVVRGRTREMRCTWDSRRRQHTNQIFFCAECLREHRQAIWAWRAVFVPVCLLHQSYLVGACPDCGEVFRYRTGVGSSVAGHWLDFWEYCSGCGVRTEKGPRTPSWLLETCISLDEESVATSDLRNLAVKLVRQLEFYPSDVQRCTEALGIPPCGDMRCTVALAILFALRSGAFVEQSDSARQLRELALAGNPRGIAHALNTQLAMYSSGDFRA